MLSNREFTNEETASLGVFGRIHETTNTPPGLRHGVILVHGRAGNETLMWVFSKIIEQLDPIVIAPRAIEEDPIGGFSWWNFESRIDGSESPAPVKTSLNHLEAGISIVSHLTEKMIHSYGVHPDKITAIGFSQGAALLGSLSLFEPKIFNKVAMLAGFLPSSVQDHFLNQKITTLPKLFMSHGTEDKIISFEMACKSRDYFLSKGADMHFHSDKVGHKISSSGMRELKEWINQ